MFTRAFHAVMHNAHTLVQDVASGSPARLQLITHAAGMVVVASSAYEKSRPARAELTHATSAGVPVVVAIGGCVCCPRSRDLLGTVWCCTVSSFLVGTVLCSRGGRDGNAQ